MTDIATAFSGTRIDRCAEMRTDAKALQRALDDPRARFVPIRNEQCLIQGEAARLVGRGELAKSVHGALHDAVFLGRLGERYLFALESGGEFAPAGDDEYVGLRSLAARIPAEDAALLAYAQAMVGWQRRHRYCGVCGQPNRSSEGGFIMACTSPRCAHRAFPRLDPAVIVLVHCGQACLLGRQPGWPEYLYSTIAGFVEPGESLEDALRREVHEETNVRVGRCDYLASQPWPFPSALMVGFHAEALTDDIRLNDAELEDAQWFDRTRITAGGVRLPMRWSVAFRLIERWFDAGPGGRRLAEIAG